MRPAQVFQTLKGVRVYAISGDYITRTRRNISTSTDSVQTYSRKHAGLDNAVYERITFQAQILATLVVKTIITCENCYGLTKRGLGEKRIERFCAIDRRDTPSTETVHFLPNQTDFFLKIFL